MSSVDPRLGPLIARLMLQRGKPAKAVAKAASMAPSYLSEIVNGRKMPTLRVAEALDRALDADGQVVDMIALGVGSEDHERLNAAVIHPGRVDDTTIATFDRLLVMQRSLDDQLGSQAMLGQTAVQMATIDGMVKTVVGPRRKALMRMAADWSLFQGWLFTSTAQWEQARAAFGRSMEWAAEAHDREVRATALSYLGHVAWLCLEPANTVGRAEAALADRDVYPGQRAYDAYQATRGYSDVGHFGEADRMLGLADELAHESDNFDGEVPACQYYRAPWFWQLERGLAKLYLARRKASLNLAAVEDLRAGLSAMPDEMRGADWAAEYMVHAAAGLMQVGELDEASVELERAGMVAEQTRSRRVAALVKGRERRLMILRRY